MGQRLSAVKGHVVEAAQDVAGMQPPQQTLQRAGTDHGDE